jgi:hypothetical protein
MSKWQFTPEELAEVIANGGTFWFNSWGQTHPPIWISGAYPFVRPVGGGLTMNMISTFGRKHSGLLKVRDFDFDVKSVGMTARSTVMGPSGTSSTAIRRLSPAAPSPKA